MREEELVRAAESALANAHAPYSGFRVGAAVEAADGRIFVGVNVENASLGLSVCAERNAIMRAVADGARDFVGMAVVTESPRITMPCGVCRQVIWEFSHDLPIVVRSGAGDEVRTSIVELFPKPFTSYRPRKDGCAS
jgi:cytidine deaminase